MLMEQTNKIGFGILCFGGEKYFRGTIRKLNNLMELGYKCYVLTDNPEFFYPKYSPFLLNVIDYKKEIKSYHDKILLVKEILVEMDVAIIVDADMKYSTDFKVLKKLKNYNFKEGISYLENLSNHKIGASRVGEMSLMLKNDWKMYFAHVNSKIDNLMEMETIWEYFLVFKKRDYKEFYKNYEKLQIIKEYCDVLENKNIVGAGEGISLSVSATLSNTPIQKDEELYNMLKDLIFYE